MGEGVNWGGTNHNLVAPARSYVLVKDLALPGAVAAHCLMSRPVKNAEHCDTVSKLTGSGPCVDNVDVCSK